MANLYELLMSKELGNIKDAPNKQRIGRAPLNLRSAMKYAAGGITDSDINAYVQANINNPIYIFGSRCIVIIIYLIFFNIFFNII
jgi:hypothetical protein